jgi:hypothetical protein
MEGLILIRLTHSPNNIFIQTNYTGQVDTCIDFFALDIEKKIIMQKD